MKKRWIDDYRTPVDPAVFLEMADLWHEAAQKPMRPAGWQPSGQGYYLADIPLNRSGLAVAKELKARGTQPAQAYLARLMHLGELIDDHRDAFPEYIRAADGGLLEVDEALLMAAAVARMNVTDKSATWDLQDVRAHAARFQAEQG